MVKKFCAKCRQEKPSIPSDFCGYCGEITKTVFDEIKESYTPSGDIYTPSKNKIESNIAKIVPPDNKASRKMHDKLYRKHSMYAALQPWYDKKLYSDYTMSGARILWIYNRWGNRVDIATYSKGKWTKMCKDIFYVELIGEGIITDFLSLFG
jgi:hypothetical protein